jgi:hypothetical protein
MSESTNASTISSQSGTVNRTSATAGSTTTGNAGRGGGGGTGSNNNNQGTRKAQNRQNQSQQTQRTHKPRSNFKGNTPDMNGHVFECYDESGDRTQFSKTLEALKQYAAKHCDRPNDLKPMFEENMTLPTILEPDDLPDDATKKEEFLWQSAMKSYSAHKDDLDSNLNSLYSVIWGQCSENMKTKIRSIAEYTEETKQDNCVWLLSQIKNVVHQFDRKKDLWTSLRHASCP